MTKRAGLFLLIVGFISISTFTTYGLPTYAVSDSTKNAKKSNSQYIAHRVEPGQTLYSLLRKYNVSMQAVKQANPGMKDNLVVGQVLKIPTSSKNSPAPPAEPVATTPKSTTTTPEREKIVVDLSEKEAVAKPKAEQTATEKITIPADTRPTEVASMPTPKPTEKSVEKIETKPVATKTGIHVVEAGQSLYGIAVKYSVLMADIRRWNSFTSDQLRTGQEVIVSEQTYQEYLRKNKIDTVKFAEAKKTVAEKLPPPPREDPTNGNLPEPKIANSGKRILETGVAEVIDGIDNSKYLALHRTAPIGSLIQVKNMSNSNSIWVKVIGKLPDISANNRIIIKLSSRAQEKLSPNGKQFIAEISYLSQ